MSIITGSLRDRDGIVATNFSTYANEWRDMLQGLFDLCCLAEFTAEPAAIHECTIVAYNGELVNSTATDLETHRYVADVHVCRGGGGLLYTARDTIGLTETKPWSEKHDVTRYQTPEVAQLYQHFESHLSIVIVPAGAPHLPLCYDGIHGNIEKFVAKVPMKWFE